ncbi:hypothetical protein [Salarchaeum japonicum]|uniref:Transmembrane protein n=1 Tax=Salarchaeum japonicum TaxID=555573 RepID=A0AAV3T189_9EURY|nr:hypothetical protein [Salarchaeum japonicum]
MADTKDYLPERLPGFRDIKPRNQAALVVLSAFVVSIAVAAVATVAGIEPGHVIPVLATVVFLLFLGASLVVFRAMFVAAQKADGSVQTAFTHPAFAVLFALVVFAGALFLGFLNQYV